MSKGNTSGRRVRTAVAAGLLAAGLVAMPVSAAKRTQRSEQPQSRHVQRNAGMPSHAGGVETGA